MWFDSLFDSSFHRSGFRAHRAGRSPTRVTTTDKTENARRARDASGSIRDDEATIFADRAARVQTKVCRVDQPPPAPGDRPSDADGGPARARSRRRSGAADTLPVLVLLPHQTKDIMHIMVLDV